MGITTRPLHLGVRCCQTWHDSDRNTQMLENSLRDNMDDLAGHKNFK